MSDTTETQAATFKELVAACPGIDMKNAADAVLIGECQEAELTTADATALYCSTLRDRIAASEAVNKTLSTEVAELNAAAALVKPKGVPAVGTKTVSETDDSTDAHADFMVAVRKEQENGKSRAEAVKTVNRTQPELREAMVAAAN